MKTFEEFVIERDKFLAEANETQHLRTVMTANMGLDKTIDDKTGEDIPLQQLDLSVIFKTLKNAALWRKLSPKVQKQAEDIFRDPQNKRLADLLDVLTSEPINIGKVMGKDDNQTPQKQPIPTPSPDIA